MLLFAAATLFAQYQDPGQSSFFNLYRGATSGSGTGGSTPPAVSELTLVNWVIADSNQVAGRVTIKDESPANNPWTTNPSNGLYIFTTQDSSAAHNNHKTFNAAYSASTSAAYATNPLWTSPPNEIILATVWRIDIATDPLTAFDFRTLTPAVITHYQLFCGLTVGTNNQLGYTDGDGANQATVFSTGISNSVYAVRMFVANHTNGEVKMYTNGILKTTGAFYYTEPGQWRFFTGYGGSAYLRVYEWRFYISDGSGSLSQLDDINKDLGTKYNISVGTITE